MFCFLMSELLLGSRDCRRQEVLDRSITAIGSGVPTLEMVISDHRQMFGKSLATNIDQERLLGDIKVQ
jgi:hypothetical protein